MTIQAYQLNKSGSPARLAMFRKMALASANNRNESTRLQPHEWKKARRYTLKSYRDAFVQLGQGFADKQSVWYCHTGAQFRDEKYADQCDGVSRSIDHLGWFTDVDCSDKARGIVARLTHGRFIVGYEWDSNEERVYFDDVYMDESEAARAADAHAESFAETAREESEKYNEALRIDRQIEERKERLSEVFALRNNPKFPHLRASVSKLCDAIRIDGETLKTDYAGVL